MFTWRSVAFLAPALAHAGYIALGDRLPQALAPAIAVSIYVPLMLLQGLGLPVFGAAESGGWPGPSLLGWALLSLFWLLVWWLLFAVVIRLLSRPT
ncbi:putative membrane protein [Hydrogenophaga sp. RAC07]|uniref:hypothetical protein n=1 Tax=Hydrogenophaga sp. RAC07 TaxID=1842537 RepID=UPI00083E1153|nr:hypothetical protein [Hydrogenophaga sp. RAC07]AOF84266.1 putative membrane protein [Hydrogenophaga sp. RAC07]